ncbi:dihydropyrimidinase [bacterium]|nr:dihydropyrimidinase [bacterium]
MTILIKGGRLVTAIDSYAADILVEDESIVAIGRDIDAPAGAELCDATGLLVLPGVIDSHVHVDLELKGHRSSDFTSTSRAAALGGVTSFLTYVTPAPGQPLMEAVQLRQEEAAGRCHVDYGLHASLVRWEDREDDEIPQMIEAGLPSFKMYTTYSESGLASSDEQLYHALLLVGRHGGLVEVHCENEWMIESKVRKLAEGGHLTPADHGASRPGYVEGEAVAAVVRAAYDAGAPVYIVHTSSGEAVQALEEADDVGLEVYAEVCPHHLLLDEGLLAGTDGQRYATCPPIRTEAHREALWEALEEGLIHVIATDHASFTAEAKDEGEKDFRQLPMGVPGVGTLLPLMWEFGVRGGRLSENELIDRLCTQPAEIFGLRPAKGTLEQGTDADIVLFDPNLAVTIAPETTQGYADYSPYDGLNVSGWPTSTMLRGRWVVKDRELVGSRELGLFIHRKHTCQRPGRRFDDESEP